MPTVRTRETGSTRPQKLVFGLLVARLQREEHYGILLLSVGVERITLRIIGVIAVYSIGPLRKLMFRNFEEIK